MRSLTIFVSVLMMFFAAVSYAPCFAETDVTLSAEIKTETPPVDIAVTPDNKYLFVLTDDAKVLIYRPQSLLKGQFDVDPDVVKIAAPGRGDTLYLMNGKDKTIDSVHIDFTEKINIGGSPFTGPEDAPVTIVEFSDFQCPYCAKVPPVLKKIQAENPKTVKLVFKNYPLSFHKYAKKAAIAAMRAARQGRFWDFYEYLFKNQGQLSKMDFDKVAVELGLDMKQFEAAKVAAEKQVEKDIADGNEIGVSGTPSVYVNGKKVKHRNEVVIQKMIDEALAKAKSGKS